MTYLANGKQYIVLPVGGKGYGAGWVALADVAASESITLTSRAPIEHNENATMPATYTAAQAKRGEAIFHEKCAECHEGNGFGPPLQGDPFRANWSGKGARSLYSAIISTMPPSDPGSLSEKSVLDVVAYIFQLNNLPAGTREIERAGELNEVVVARGK